MPDRPSLCTPMSPPPRYGAVAALTLALLPALARADVEWHADLDTARAASRLSRRPVLAVFVASWSAAATALEATSLGSPEAEAVLATCFEPVRIDIDGHPNLTRSAGITHVPTACVLADDDAPLASFEMPQTSTEFVTTAILTARRVAAREADAPNADAATTSTVPTTAAASGAGSELPVTAAAFGTTTDPAAITARPPRGSMARVAAKVRDLSAFARSQSQPAPRAEPTAIAHVGRSVNAMPSYVASSSTASSSGASSSGGPSYTAPVSWPAVPSTAPPTGLAQPPLDPAPAALTPSGVAPWLDAPPAPQAAPAPVAAMPAPSTAPLPPTTPAPAPPAARQSGLIAALQKPFGIGPKTEPPATMPPALPRGPFAAAEPSTPVPAPAAPSTAPAAAEEDRYGSMPLGLEGYCPVTLVDRGSWQEGRAQWGARHRGRTYLFAGPDEQRTFLSNPDRYAPALSGDDPVLALDRGTMTPGQRRYGVTYQARMYLFATPETRQAFTADPGRYVGRVTIAERTPAQTNSPTRVY